MNKLPDMFCIHCNKVVRNPETVRCPTCNSIMMHGLRAFITCPN